MAMFYAKFLNTLYKAKTHKILQGQFFTHDSDII